MKQAWMLAAAVALATATTATSVAQRASLPALPTTTSAPVGEIGVGPAPIPLHPTPLRHPRPLPDSKPSSAPAAIAITPPPPAPNQPPVANPPANSPEESHLGAALLGHPVADVCCAQPQHCECPLCLLRRRLTTRFRHLLGGCACCYCGCDPPSLAESVACRVRAEEACAPARLCAVRYLGTVDCHYYPEAEEALIASLRCDRNRCVRQEAACALGSGCCGTPRVLEALTLVVAAGEDDGNPCETCDDVRRAAFQSLQKLLGHVGEGDGRLAAAIARARITMAQAAGSAWVACAYRCPPPPQRNLAEVIANAARNRHSTGTHSAGTHSAGTHSAGTSGSAASSCELAIGDRYFPPRSAPEPMVAVGVPGPLPGLFYGHTEHVRPAFDLPRNMTTPTSTTSLPRPSTPRPELRDMPVKNKPLAMLGGVPLDVDDPQELPVLIPAGGLLSASAARQSPRSLLPPGLTPLGRVPDAEE